MKLAISCDHRGLLLKEALIDHLRAEGHVLIDYGTYTPDSCDYPVYGRAVAKAVASGACDRGIIICGTGIGISITANKIPGIRAALCTDCFCAEATRLHNDANMLALGGAFVGEMLAKEIVDVFLETEFSGEEKHVRRVNKLESE